MAAKTPTTYAYCFASGLIEFGDNLPEGALPIATGPEATLREFIETRARHGYSTELVNGRPTKIPGAETLLVPGIPEAANQFAGVDALRKFVNWIKPAALDAGLSILGDQLSTKTSRNLRPSDEELAKLPAHARDVLEALRNGKLYREIADTLDLPIGTVRSRINRARARVLQNRTAAETRVGA